MDEVCHVRLNSKEASKDQEKIGKAIKKAKADLARKAVNKSLNRSIASIKRRKQKKQATLDQINALKQASVLQQKNSTILSALTKAKQYNRQLENANYCFKEQQDMLSAQLTYKIGRIPNREAENELLRKEIENADAMLKEISRSFSNALFANFHIERSGSSQSSTDSVYSPGCVVEPVTSHDIVSMDLTDTMPASNITLQDNINANTEQKTGDEENVPPSGLKRGENIAPVEFVENTSENLEMIKLQNSDCYEKSDTAELLSDKDFSPRFTRRSSTQRNSTSETDDENEKPVRRRSSRSATAVSYAEPSLSSKLRRGDKTTDGSLYHSFTPKKIIKKRR